MSSDTTKEWYFEVSATVVVAAPNADEARSLVWELLNGEQPTADADVVTSRVGRAIGEVAP